MYFQGVPLAQEEASVVEVYSHGGETLVGMHMVKGPL